MPVKLYNQFHKTWCSRLGSTYGNVVSLLLYLVNLIAVRSQLPYFPF